MLVAARGNGKARQSDVPTPDSGTDVGIGDRLNSQAREIRWGSRARSLFDGPSHLAELFVWDRVRAPLQVAFEAFREREISASQRPIIHQGMRRSMCIHGISHWSPRINCSGTRGMYFSHTRHFSPCLTRWAPSITAASVRPRFILYRYESIDNQHPCLVDPRTWLAIYRWYDLQEGRFQGK